MTTTDRDEQLAELLTRLTDELRQERVPDIEQVARQHPELASDLRELWTAVLVAEGLGALGSSVTEGLPAGVAGVPLEYPTTPPTLPILKSRPAKAWRIGCRDNSAITNCCPSWAAVAWASFTKRSN